MYMYPVCTYPVLIEAFIIYFLRIRHTCNKGHNYDLLYKLLKYMIHWLLRHLKLVYVYGLFTSVIQYNLTYIYSFFRLPH